MGAHRDAVPRGGGLRGVGALFEGMELAEISPGLGQYFGTNQGVLVIRVPRDGEFLKLQDGDVILSIDGRVPEDGSHAARILRSYRPRGENPSEDPAAEEDAGAGCHAAGAHELIPCARAAI